MSDSKGAGLNDNQLETVAILARLIQKARRFEKFGDTVMAVPIIEISGALEAFVTTQTAPKESV